MPETRGVQPVRVAATQSTKPGAVAAWHAQRRNAIAKRLGPDAVAALEAPTPVKTLTALVGANALQIVLASQVPQLGGAWWFACASTLGAWLSLVQFACLHDVVHGGADFVDEPALARKERRERVLRFGSQPSVFGYWLYLALGHLNHHASTGDATPRELFDSSRADFEDGDLFFALHRQEAPGGAAADPVISIARTSFRNLWGDDVAWNALCYAASSVSERAALCANDKVVALSGSNAFFFPNKPDEFHATCASYARFAALWQLGVVALAGGDLHALGYLLVAETAWQLPPWPAAALFVSNHGVDAETRGVGGAAEGRPTHSVYGPAWFDALCFHANYHAEHHDFPKVPLWRLPELRRRAGPDFYPESPPWREVLRGAFATPISYPRWERFD